MVDLKELQKELESAFKEVDASFDRFPVVFKNYASQFWDKYIEAENEKFRSERKN